MLRRLASIAAGTLLGATLAAVPAMAYSTDDVAANAETHTLGSWGGQCKAFVNGVVYAATGISLSGYQQGFANAGAVEITNHDNAVRGDIIQITPAGSTDATAESKMGSTSSTRLHTTIIRGPRNPDGTFNVVDSNWGLDEKVREHVLNPDSWASGSIVKIWRFGTPALPPGAGSNYIPSVPKPVTYAVGGAQRLDVYAVASDHNVYRNTWNGSSWTTASTSIGCCFERDPSVVSYAVGGTSYVDVYGLSSDHNIYHNTWNGTSWSSAGFTSIGCCFTTDPTVVAYTVGTTSYVDVYAVASNGHMYRNTWNGSSWSQGYSWSTGDIGCCFTNHAPTAVTYKVGTTSYIDLYNTASDHNVYRNRWNGSSWTGFSPIGCCFVSDPAAVAYTVGTTSYVDVYAVASNGHMYRDVWNGTSWSQGSSWGGGDVGCCFTDHTPTVTTYQVGTTSYIDLYNTATNSNIYRNTWNGSNWSSAGFTPIGCCFATDPTAVTYQVGTTSYVDVYAVASNRSLYHNTWNGTVWSEGASWGGGYIGCCFDHLN